MTPDTAPFTEVVEAAARDAYERSRGRTMNVYAAKWEDASAGLQRLFRQDVGAVLTAAGVPELIAEVTALRKVVDAARRLDVVIVGYANITLDGLVLRDEYPAFAAALALYDEAR
jgi:hypothetical protein